MMKIDPRNETTWSRNQT